MSRKQRKKVLYLITKSNWGGAQRYVYDLATHLNTDKFEPVVALGGDGTLKERLDHVGIRVIQLKSLERDVSLKKEWDSAREIFQLLRLERPAVLHVNSSKAGALGTLIGRISRVPRVIFTAHGWAFNEDRPLWQKSIIKAVHWLTIIFSHQTIAVSGAIVSQMNWLGVKSKMKIINPGRTIGAMYSKKEARAKLIEVCPLLSEVQNDPWLISIAELHPIKRFNVLIETIHRIKKAAPKLRCIIIGEGEERARLEAMISQCDLKSTIFLMGNITEAARFLKAADIFVLPSKSESYGYVLHEAGLAELPVIATNVGGIKDIITSGETGRLIAPDSPEQLGRLLLDFLADKSDWLTQAQLLHKKMADRSVQKMTAATEAVYSSSKENC